MTTHLTPEPCRRGSGEIPLDLCGREDAQGSNLAQRLLDLTADAVIVRNADDRVIFWNRGAEELYGWTGAQVLGRVVHDVLLPRSPLPADDVQRRLARDRRWEGEVTQTTRDGSPRIVLSRMVYDQDPHGRSIIVETNTDITQRKQAEAAVRESEARFRTMADSSPVNIWVTNTQGDWDFINATYRAFCGLAEREMQGDRWRMNIHPEEAGSYAVAWNEAVHSQSPFEATCRLKRADGQWRWTVSRGIPRFGSHGEYLGHVGSSVDIHDLVAAQQALKDSEERFRRFFEMGLVGFAITSPTKGWVEVNDELCRILGYDRTELMRKTWAELTHPDDLPNSVDQFTRTLAGEIDCCTVDKRYIRKDGRVIDAALSVGVIRGADGAVDYFVVLVKDITERKRAEAALLTSEERYRAFIAHSMEGIWRIELEPPIDTGLSLDDQIDLAFERARIAECNDAMSRMYGLRTADELIGRPLGHLLPPLEPESRAFLASIIQTGYRVSELESVERDARGRTVYFSNSMIGIVSNGQLVRVWGSQRDITERKHAEQALKQSEERFRDLAERLESRVVERTQELEETYRQLRALATELNLTEQRERKRLATELHDHLAQMLVLSRMKISQAKRLAGLDTPCGELLVQADRVLTDSLNYTRTLVSDLSPPVLYEFGLVAALRWLAERMRQHDLSVTITVQCQDPLPVHEEHAVLLFQSARELLMNVVKHAGCQDAALHLRQLPDELRIEVRDEGQGVPIPSQSAAGAGRSAPSKFGLFSIRERMKALGGLFEFQSAAGHGTRATLVLPLAGTGLSRPEAAVSGHERFRTVTAAPPVHPEAQRMFRVLLVDDHAMLREGLRTVLETYPDVQVVGEAKDGAEALQLADQLDPTVVVMDINMPRMNGIEATGRLKAHRPHTVVIGLSVNAEGDNVQAMRAAGASTLLTKEAAVEHLHDVIQQAVGE